MILCFILTAYTIYGGTFTGEQIGVREVVEDYFNNLEQVLGNKELDMVEKEAVKHSIKDIEVNNNKASVELEVTGIDNTKLTYELIMYHTFIERLAVVSNEIVNLPDSHNIYVNITKKNLGSSKKTNLTVSLEKTNGKWKITDESRRDLFSALRSTDISYKEFDRKAHENLKLALEKQTIKYKEEKPDITLSQYLINYIKDFVNNEGYITEFPFEKQVFMKNKPVTETDVTEEGRETEDIVVEESKTEEKETSEFTKKLIKELNEYNNYRKAQEQAN